MTWRLHPDVSTVDTDYGTVLLNGSDGRYWQLNATASLAFRALVEGSTVQEATERLMASFDVDEPRARADVEQLMASLRQAKVVQQA
ncbi:MULTISPECIES: lasso peptide biosynthesis PqqD family chaperone [Streptomyces]|uniref:lasso peptide biosynthesis PqqD family chaperone n=1 Tax=Streptomyces TaxID=1883 RepID=UPI001962A89A|nr:MULTISPECIES: lasso peptide biosynthesis PqqD family chaperone [Streptomyces]QRX96362.1 lasso peptide biosynthesis PqqD family chaperone [Streptomyces noursei]UJB44889.1 lasso peptide biosynthesis PqqD family chaperone [Streptomyces sp. A1-5]